MTQIVELNNVKPSESSSSVAGMDGLLFALADVLQMDLHETPEGIRGVKQVNFNIGNVWGLPSSITCCVDECSNSTVSAFVRIRKGLWGYFIITPALKWVFMFQGDLHALNPGGESKVGTKNAGKTLLVLKKSIVSAFELRDVGEGVKWEEVDKDEVLMALPQ